MSLVAYASSAESDSDSEPPESPPEPPLPQRGGGLFSSLPPPKNSKAQFGVPTESGFVSAFDRTAPPGLPEELHTDSWLGLPPPRRSGLNLPAPSGDTTVPGAKKRTEPVRISAPQLHRNDSDSEEDVPAKKKAANRGAAEGTGLSALLPQPKNLAGNESKRQLLPYSFTKKAAKESLQDTKPTKPAASLKAKSASASDVQTTLSPSLIKAAAKSASLQITKQITQEEEDSDEEVKHGNFFSLSDNSPINQTEALAYKANLATQVTLLVTDPVKLPDETADASLEFNSPESPGTPPPPGTTSWEPREDIHSHAFNRYTEYSDSSCVPSHTPPPPSGPPLYQEYYDAGYYEQSDQPMSSPTESGSEQSSLLNEEAFKRLQGKRNRGKEEINFLEIKGDDQLSSNQQWMTKSLTEEKNMKSFSKKKGEQPTGQQRRKHQITYLIHQAKERELELKNAWSDNKLSRRQTQAKYGF